MIRGTPPGASRGFTRAHVDFAAVRSSLPSTLLLAILAMSPACSPTSSIDPPATDDGGAVLYVGGTVLTLDAERPEARGLRVEGDRITHVFDEVPEGLTGRRVELDGAVVLPGLVDAHLHLRAIGTAARRLDLRGTTSAEQIAGMVDQAADQAAEGSWIRGRGWDQNDWTVQRFPVAEALDEASAGHPVWLSRIDGHAVWLNSAAMELAGIGPETEAPAGGEIIRHPDGRPTGIFVDNAIDLISGALPEPTAAEMEADYLRAIELCNATGLTGVHTMGVDPMELAALRALHASGRLSLRTTAYLADGEQGLAQPTPSDDGLLRVLGVKLYADGALGSRGAALLAPYSDRPDTTGLLLTEPDVLQARIGALHADGWQVAVHAIGDRGNRVVLDAVEAVQGDDRSRRHRIEHAQIVDPSDIPRFAELGIVASMQPTHATSDMPWADERLGTERLAGAYAWRSMLDAGAVLAFGSDAPIELVHPWPGVFSAVARQDGQGQPEGGWLPEQRLPVLDALAAFTRGAAVAGHQEADLGAIRPGALADLTVVASDPRTTPVGELPAMVIKRTIVGGEEVFASTGGLR
jgi:predicted amidohydrolase YtcJ